jgi:hypothetical protein
MDTTFDFISISIVGGICLGLFVSIFCYGFKRICLVKNHNKKECDFVKEGIEMKDMELQSLSNSGIYEEPDPYIHTHGIISTSTTILVLNDLVQKMKQAKHLEDKVRQHEKMIEKISMETKTLEQKLNELERKSVEGSAMHTARMNVYELEDENNKPSVCACKVGDNFHCLADC